MYDRILVAIDATPTEENRSAQTRAEQIGRLTGATVYVLHVARAHIIPGDIIGGAGFGVRSADEDVEGADRQAVQALVDRLSAAGVDAHGEIVSATQHDVAGAIRGPAGAWSSTPPWCGQCVPLKRRRLDYSPPPAVFDLIGPTSSRALTTFGGSMCWLFRFFWKCGKNLNASGHC